MGHRADQLAVLENGRAAHALHNPACLGEKLRVGDLNTEISAFRQVISDLGYTDCISFCVIAGNGAENLSISLLDFILEGDRVGDTVEIIISSAIHKTRVKVIIFLLRFFAFLPPLAQKAIQCAIS